jgi:cytochrome c-type biogenesis protein CcmH
VHLSIEMQYALPPYLIALYWLAILIALIGATCWVLRASARGESQEGDRADLGVYADQVGEIDRDLAQGRISISAAEAGRLEIGRRLVRARDRVLTVGPRANRIVLGGVAAAISLLAAGLYVVSGSPGRADLPFQARERELLSRDPATLTQDEIIVLLQERARLNPDDPIPHALMGQVLSAAGRDQDALRAYQAVLRRAPNDGEAIAEAAGILVRLNNGQIGPDAQQAFDAALKVNPKSPSARYYLALADWQGGRRDGAMTAWANAYQALSDQPAAQEVFAARVVGAISQLESGPDMGSGAAPAMAQLQAQDGTQADPSAFIASMIASRVARLIANPNDVALRLSVVRVLMMSGRAEEARKALLDGVERADDNSFNIALYGVAARALVSSSPAKAPVTKR